MSEQQDEATHDETSASSSIDNAQIVYALVNNSGGFEAEAFFDKDEALLSASMHHEPFGVVEMIIPAKYEPQDTPPEKPKTRSRTRTAKTPGK